jgi:hypothetical protein
MEMVRVSSSAMTAVGYDPISQRMKIQFKQGDTYDFCRVPQRVYDGLMMSASKGGYYTAYIRDRYQC